MAWGGWDKRRQHACRFCCDHFKSDRSNWFTQMARLGLAYCVWFFGGTLPRNFVLHSHRLAWRQWCLPSRPPETLKDLPPLNKYCQIFLAIRFLLVLSFLVIFLLFFFVLNFQTESCSKNRFVHKTGDLPLLCDIWLSLVLLRRFQPSCFFLSFLFFPLPLLFDRKRCVNVWWCELPPAYSCHSFFFLNGLISFICFSEMPNNAQDSSSSSQLQWYGITCGTQAIARSCQSPRSGGVRDKTNRTWFKLLFIGSVTMICNRPARQTCLLLVSCIHCSYPFLSFP